MQLSCCLPVTQTALVTMSSAMQSMHKACPVPKKHHVNACLWRCLTQLCKQVLVPQLETEHLTADYKRMVMQLTERRQGNQHYRQKHFDTALAHYNNARSILESLASNAAEEQQEIDTNLVKVYLNIAAVYLAQQLFGKAIAWCTKVLAKDPQNAKALLRRAKAHIGRHNYQVCSRTSPHQSCLSAGMLQVLRQLLLQGTWLLLHESKCCHLSLMRLICAECSNRLVNLDPARPCKPGSAQPVTRDQSKGVCRQM